MSLVTGSREFVTDRAVHCHHWGKRISDRKGNSALFQGANHFGRLAADAADHATEEAKAAAADPSKLQVITPDKVAPAKDGIAPAKDATAPAKDAP